MIMAPGLNSKAIEKRQANQVLDLLPIGEFVNTQHAVRGMVWAYNNSLLLVEDFAYDGLGFGVYLQVATEGETIQEWVCNISFTNYCDMSFRFPFTTVTSYYVFKRIIGLRKSSLPPSLTTTSHKFILHSCPSIASLEKLPLKSLPSIASQA